MAYLSLLSDYRYHGLWGWTKASSVDVTHEQNWLSVCGDYYGRESLDYAAVELSVNRIVAHANRFVLWRGAAWLFNYQSICYEYGALHGLYLSQQGFNETEQSRLSELFNRDGASELLSQTPLPQAGLFSRLVSWWRGLFSSSSSASLSSSPLSEPVDAIVAYEAQAPLHADVPPQPSSQRNAQSIDSQVPQSSLHHSDKVEHTFAVGRQQVHWFEQLGVKKGIGDRVSKSEIKRAFLPLARKHHPDKGGEEEAFKQYCEAYKELCQWWLQQAEAILNQESMEHDYERMMQEMDDFINECVERIWPKYEAEFITFCKEDNAKTNAVYGELIEGLQSQNELLEQCLHELKKSIESQQLRQAQRESARQEHLEQLKVNKAKLRAEAKAREAMLQADAEARVDEVRAEAEARDAKTQSELQALRELILAQGLTGNRGGSRPSGDEVAPAGGKGASPRMF